MPEALPALPLAAFLAAFVALVLAEKAEQIIKPIFQVLHDSIGHLPFVGSWVDSGLNKVLEALNALVMALRAAATTFWQGFLWSMRETVSVIDHAGSYLEDHLTQLEQHALPTAFSNLWADVNSLASDLGGRISRLAQTVHDNLVTAEHYADGAAAGALHDAKRYTDSALSTAEDYTDSAVKSAKATLETDIGNAKAAAIKTAEDYADRVRKAVEAELAADIAGVETELGNAVRQLNATITSVQTTLTGELTTAEQTLGAEIATTAATLERTLTAAEATLNQAIAAAEATASAELAQLAGQLGTDIAAVRSRVDAIAGEIATAASAATAELADIYGLGADDLRRLVDSIDLSKLVEYGAGLVLLRGLIEALTAEAGLDRAECRSKVKGICGTDPTRWANLLAGLAAVGLAFDLRQLVQVATAIAPTAEDLVKQAAGR